ncbi:MAG TPA: hypothetical protein DDW42_10395 [Desulfobacteraceae bacterium]|nr:hypothetical protein [Desulfobacteraceae bacterium]
MADYLGLCLQLERMAMSQYANWNFNSMTKFNGQYLGANENGLFVLSDGDLDGVSEIPAFFELLTSDWGIENQKRVRSMYVGYETNGRLKFAVKDDDGNETEYILEANHLDNAQHGAKLPGSRKSKGRYWMVKVDNMNGADFSVDNIRILPVILGKKPSSA